MRLKTKDKNRELGMVNGQLATSYDTIPIDRYEITQSLLNIDDKKRSNFFAWSGQFSPQFIETLLEQYAGDGFTVADPFLGSGTVIHECARKNISAVGCELNPSAYCMAKTYELCRLNKEQRENLIQTVEEILVVVSFNPNPLDSLLHITREKLSSPVHDIVSLIVVLLDLFNNTFSRDLLFDKWGKLAWIIRSLPYSSSTVHAMLGDARKLEIRENEMDLIITSPPYINVFNYHQKYRRSVESLGYDVLKIARKEIGANRKNRGNRYLTVIEYCIDMSLALREMARVAKPNARLILVVGRESNILSTAFSNSELIYELAHGVHGFPLILKQQRVFKNKFGQMIYEDILHFSNDKLNHQMLADEDMVESSRCVAVRALKEKMDVLDDTNKNYPLIRSAIESAPSVTASEGR
jgi:hypothetical protein